MNTIHIVFAILLGLGLSASTGLNTFLPLLMLSAAARFHIAGVALGGKFAWLSSDIAIGVLIVACVIEIVGDKVPAVDHFLDTIGTFLRPLAGALASASVLTGVDPAIAAMIGIVVGAPTALGLHTLKAGTRVASSATTLGCANPALSLAEDVISFVMSVIAIFAPLIVPFVLLFVVWVFWRIVRKIRRPTAATDAGGAI